MKKTAIRLYLPPELDYKLNLHMAELKRLGIKRTKADEIIRLAWAGLQIENTASQVIEQSKKS